jgi:hypothetical protein
MDDQSKQRTSAIRAALYARLSCEQQAQQSTIDSQIVALHSPSAWRKLQ